MADLSTQEQPDENTSFSYTGPSLIGLRCGRMNTAKLTQGYEFYMNKTQILSTPEIKSKKLKKSSNWRNRRKKSMGKFTTKKKKQMNLAKNGWKSLQSTSKIQKSIWRNLLPNAKQAESRNEKLIKWKKSPLFNTQKIKVIRKKNLKFQDFKVYDICTSKYSHKNKI